MVLCTVLLGGQDAHLYVYYIILLIFVQRQVWRLPVVPSIQATGYACLDHFSCENYYSEVLFMVFDNEDSIQWSELEIWWETL